MAFSNMFAFMSGVGSFSFGKTWGALNCLNYLGEIKRAISSDILISLVTSEMFLSVMKSILVMLLIAVIAMIGVAIIKNGQNELPKMKKNGDSFFKRVLRLFLVALIVPVMAISGVGVDGNVRKGSSAYITLQTQEIATDLYSCSILFEDTINNHKNLYSQYKLLFDESKETYLYINSDEKEVVFAENEDFEVNDSYKGIIYYGNGGDGYKKYVRECRESTLYKITSGFGGDYSESSVSGFFVKFSINYYTFNISSYSERYTPGYIYFFVSTDNGDAEAYYYYITKHLRLEVVWCDFDNKNQNCDFEVYKNSENNHKPSELYTYYEDSTPKYSGLMGFINKTKGSNGSLYGFVEDFIDNKGRNFPGCLYHFESKGLMASGGFFENEKNAPSDCKFYFNDLKNGINYFTVGDYNDYSLAYSCGDNIYSYTNDSGNNIKAIVYNNWNTVNSAMKFTSMLPTGGSAIKLRDPYTPEQIAALEAQENSGSGYDDEYGNGSGTNHGSASDEELNKNIDKTAVATYKRFIGIVNTILPFAIGFVLALALFYGLNVALRYARADEIEDKKKAKQNLINIVVGAIIAIVLTSIIILILNGDFIINILESMK